MLNFTSYNSWAPKNLQTKEKPFSLNFRVIFTQTLGYNFCKPTQKFQFQSYTVDVCSVPGSLRPIPCMPVIPSLVFRSVEDGRDMDRRPNSVHLRALR